MSFIKFSEKCDVINGMQNVRGDNCYIEHFFTFYLIRILRRTQEYFTVQTDLQHCGVGRKRLFYNSYLYNISPTRTHLSHSFGRHVKTLTDRNCMFSHDQEKIADRKVTRVNFNTASDK